MRTTTKYVQSTLRSFNKPNLTATFLLLLLKLRNLLLRTFRIRSTAHIRPQRSIPPSERARIIAQEFLMVDIMVIRARPEWQEMV
jgi:hypothetical protein